MKRFPTFLLIGFAIMTAQNIRADDTGSGSASGRPALSHLVVSHAVIHTSPLPGGNGAAYCEVANRNGPDDTLLAAATAIADHVELHSMSMSGGMMQMRPLTGGLPVPAGKTAVLDAQGTHLMLVELKQTPAPGAHVPVTLDFAKAGPVRVDFEVHAPGQ